MHKHPQATLILLAFVVSAVTYSVIVPPFEAGDESRHYAVVKYLADTGRLIDQNGPDIREIQHHWSHEGNQPPLYYVLAATLTARIETGTWDDVFWYNPHTTIGNPLRPDNKNITIHPPAESWPWRNHVLAVHIIRFMSIAMATVTVAFCYLIALSLFQGNRWLAAGAMAITAFNPMFIFISASVNNDNAVIMFITLALWLMVRIADQSAAVTAETPRLSLFSVALLGLLIGLGALSKLYAFGLLPIVGLLFVWVAYRQEQATSSEDQAANRQSGISLTNRIWSKALSWSLLLGLVFLAIAGWFYIRNAMLYQGDILALDVMRSTAGQRDEAPSLETIRAEFKGFRIAYWALFGGVNILVNDWIYAILDWVSLIAAIGVIALIIRLFYVRFRPRRSDSTPYLLDISLPTLIILLSWYLIMIVGFIAWNLTQPAGQGRLLYPAIAAISALGMLGLSGWLPEAGRKIVSGLCIASLFALVVVSSFLYIKPVYAKPIILSDLAELPATLQSVDFLYDQSVRLVGYQLHKDIIRPAQSLPITLYWEILQPVDIDYSIFVHILGRQREVIGQIDTYPGGGSWPTTMLSPGDILADYYEISIRPEAEFTQAPTQLRIAAGIYDYSEVGRPGRAAINRAGAQVEPIIATAKLVPWQWPTPEPGDPLVNFFDKATLLSHQLTNNDRQLTLNWQVNGTFENNYTVFIQAWRTPGGEYAAGFDGPPVRGDYPTSLWSPGEIVVDSHPLDLTMLPPGQYDLVAGLYNPTTGERLPAFGPDGPLPDYAVHLGQLQVME